MSDLITVKRIRAAIATHHISYWPLRSCSICEVPLNYEFRNNSVFYNSACRCTSYGGVEETTWEDFADTFNRQTQEVRDKLWRDFISMGKS